MRHRVDSGSTRVVCLQSPHLLRDLGILVHIFTSTCEITTSNHATTPMLPLSLDIISYVGVSPWGNDNIVPAPAIFFFCLLY